MKKYFVLLAVVTFLVSCGKVEKPTVVTLDVMRISVTSAMCSGNVESDGGAEVTAKGVCWAKTQNPTIENDKTNAGTGVGEFVSEITRQMNLLISRNQKRLIGHQLQIHLTAIRDMRHFSMLITTISAIEAG